MTACTECGFVYESREIPAIPGAVRSFGDRYSAELVGVDEMTVRRRPEPQVWSALEYACHVRDVFLVQRDRVIRALVEDCPAFARMHRDERVGLARYAAEGPSAVAEQLTMAADLLAYLFDGLSPEQFGRSCRYNYPEPVVRDIAWVGRHTVHEGEHHLIDIRSALG